jgi:GT2 family glycosyltransferase
VVVCTYNRAEQLREALGSLISQQTDGRFRYEVLVVDNASTDGTCAALEPYADRVTLLHETRRGAGAARNAGLAAASGEVVAFTDADSTVDPDWLAQLVIPLRDPGVGVAGGTILAADPSNAVERYGEGIHDHQKSIEVFQPAYAVTGSWASPRALLERLGGFDERFLRCQDVDLSYRIQQAGHSLAFAPGAVVRHSNERTLAGLAREGFTHGFHSVRAIKRHEQFLLGFGHRRIDRRGYAALVARLRDWARGRDRDRARLDVAFNAGKKAGKLLGSIRFGHLDL